MQQMPGRDAYLDGLLALPDTPLTLPRFPDAKWQCGGGFGASIVACSNAGI